ncbi:hypothetical protein STEG23_034889, partial [Scotinomys teguina]
DIDQQYLNYIFRQVGSSLLKCSPVPVVVVQPLITELGSEGRWVSPSIITRSFRILSHAQYSKAEKHSGPRAVCSLDFLRKDTGSFCVAQTGLKLVTLLS